MHASPNAKVNSLASEAGPSCACSMANARNLLVPLSVVPPGSRDVVKKKAKEGMPRGHTTTWVYSVLELVCGSGLSTESFGGDGKSED
jgi:hypothetical protein